MVARFTSPAQKQLYDRLVAELKKLGYKDELFREDYPFPDWFATNQILQRVDAAAFGNLPRTHETACFGVMVARDEEGPALVNRCRAFGAPWVFEVLRDRVRWWPVATGGAQQFHPREIAPDDLRGVF